MRRLDVVKKVLCTIFILIIYTKEKKADYGSDYGLTLMEDGKIPSGNLYKVFRYN